MKKQILLAAACCGLAFATQAQGVKFGPRIGINMANMAIDPEEEGVDPKSRTGLQAGLVVNIGVNEMFSIQPEILYSSKGYKIEESIFGIEFSQELATSYIEVPVLAKLQFGSGSVKPYINAGPYVGYWMGGKTTANFFGIEESEDIDFDSDSSGFSTANRLDVGLNIGAGLGFEVGSGQLSLDVRYGLGLTNTMGDKPEDWDDDLMGEFPSMNNRVLGISVAYLFGGGE